MGNGAVSWFCKDFGLDTFPFLVVVAIGLYCAEWWAFANGVADVAREVADLSVVECFCQCGNGSRESGSMHECDNVARSDRVLFLAIGVCGESWCGFQ